MPGPWGWRLLDLAVYAVGLTLAVVVALVPPSLLAGAGWNGVKFGLFLVGTLSFGYATYLLWPARPEPASGPDHATGPDRATRQSGAGGRGSSGDAARRDRRPGSRAGLRTASRPERGGRGGRGGPREATRFEAALDRIPPLSRSDLRPGQRLHPGTKLYVASFLMLGVSYAMEAVLGVGG